MVHLKLRQHLFFDLDDTLWDFKKNSEGVLRKIFIDFDLGKKLNTNFEIFFQEYGIINKQLWSAYYKQTIDKHYLRNNRFELTFQHFNYSNYDENLAITETYLGKAPHGTSLKDGCIEVLDYLFTKYKLHIITNGFLEVQHIKLNGSGIKKYFQNAIISEEYNLVKPNEKIFRLAEERVFSKKEHCIMIGDSLESDVLGAVNAGWEAIFLNNDKEPYSGHQIESLLDLKMIF